MATCLATRVSKFPVLAPELPVFRKHALFFRLGIFGCKYLNFALLTFKTDWIGADSMKISCYFSC